MEMTPISIVHIKG